MKQHRSILIGVIVALISFILIYTGIRFINNSNIIAQNILSYSVLSLILGGVSTTFHYYNKKYALIFFIIGIGIGYFEMYRSFINGLNGWGDLAGIMSLFAWIIIGLITGIIVQAGSYLYKKYNSRGKHKK